MKHITLFIFIIGLLVLAGCGTNNLDDITVRLPVSLVHSSFSPFYIAIDQGFYAEEGITVVLEGGTRENNPIKMVAAGIDEFGVIGGPDTLLTARSREVPVKALAVMHKDANFVGLLTHKDSGLTTLEDIEGKKVGFFYGHISTDILRNLFHSQKIEYEEINVGFDYSQFIAGKLDVIHAFRTYAALTLPAQGIEVNFISPKDYGITSHGYTIFATEEMIDDNPELVEKFLRATLKGITYSLDHPEESIQVLVDRKPSVNVALERQMLQLYAEVLSNSEEFPAGYMDYEMFKETYDRLLEENVIEQEFDVREAFTTTFLEKIHS